MCRYYSVAFFVSINKYWINLSSHSSLAKRSYLSDFSEISCSQNTTQRFRVTCLFTSQYTTEAYGTFTDVR